MLEKNEENHMSSNSKFTESKPKHTEMESHKKYILKKNPYGYEQCTSLSELGIDLKLLSEFPSRMKYLLREYCSPNRLKRMR